MQFTQTEQPEIDIHAPLIYLWKISNAAGEVMGWYVGKAEGGAKRPTRDYACNVNRLLRGKAYRTQGRDYRRVHEAMADAVRAGYAISLRYLCNVSPDEDIYVVEQHYVREYGCLGDHIGLNAQHQGRKRRKIGTTQTTEMSDMKATTGIAETTKKGECGLAAFRQLIASHYPQLQPREGAKRYSFYTHDNVRIVRAEQKTLAGRVNIKLALISLQQGGNRTFNWDGTSAQVLDAIEGELHLYEQHFKKE